MASRFVDITITSSGCFSLTGTSYYIARPTRRQSGAERSREHLHPRLRPRPLLERAYISFPLARRLLSIFSLRGSIACKIFEGFTLSSLENAVSEVTRARITGKKFRYSSRGRESISNGERKIDRQRERRRDYSWIDLYLSRPTTTFATDVYRGENSHARKKTIGEL